MKFEKMDAQIRANRLRELERRRLRLQIIEEEVALGVDADAAAADAQVKAEPGLEEVQRIVSFCYAERRRLERSVGSVGALAM